MFEIIKNSSKIEIKDYRDFVPGKDANGGQYAYYYAFEKKGNGFVVRYSTSAEFEFCTKYGNFQSCHRCMFSQWHGDVWSCNAPDEIWSLKQVMDFIIKNKNDKDFEVFIDDIKLE